MAAPLLCRAVDSQGDWQFGAGVNDYVANLREVQQDIALNLRMFLGDCFFDTTVGIDWFNLLGQKGPAAQLALNLAINAAILNTTGVTGLRQSFLTIDRNRRLRIQYTVLTVFSTLSGEFTFDTGTLG